MIRRRASDGFWLIRQIDHARFAGLLAAQFGESGFAPPNDEVKAAIAHHDDGWALHDDQPSLNERGLPLNVFEIPTGMATRIWSASVDRAIPLGPYTALLVSLHQLALSDYAIRQGGSTAQQRAKSTGELFELNKFQHRQIEIQESLRRELKMRTDLPLNLGLAQAGADPKDDQLAYDFQLLTLCDRLSLQLCMGQMLFPTIQNPRSLFGSTLPDIHSRFVDEWHMELTPIPFVWERTEGQIAAKHVSGMSFKNEAQFREEYSRLPVQMLTIGVS